MSDPFHFQTRLENGTVIRFSNESDEDNMKIPSVFELRVGEAHTRMSLGAARCLSDAINAIVRAEEFDLWNSGELPDHFIGAGRA